jgi:phenylacetate-coenzyme A ligase PaaK-like adenylate-forming protein
MFVRTLALVQDAEICRSPGYVVCHQTKDLRNTGSFAASSYLCGMLGSHVVLGLTISPPEHHAKLIKEHGIKWIASSPGFFVALSAWSAANDRVLQSSGLEVVHAAGAPIDDTLRLRVMDELGLRSFHRAYASTELGFVGVACSSEAVYTMFSDEYVFEIVDDDGEHVMPGQRGRVLVTVLSSDAAPLIRYENGDTARYVGDTCPATGFAVLDKIGRRLTAILCDAKVTYDDIAAIPDVMSQRGVVTSAFQLAKQREPDGRDRICIRVETDIADHASCRSPCCCPASFEKAPTA